MDPKPFETPRNFFRADTSRRFAYVTFLVRNDSYLPGALVLAHGLRRQRTSADLVCLVTPEITRHARDALRQLFDRVIEVETFFVPHRRRQERQDRPYWFTRLNALRLGADGDLGTRYEKVVILDADLLPLRHYDHLFLLRAPAGIINERKSHLVERDARGDHSAERAKAGEWRWHRLYDPICPHGHPIPANITDRVRRDPSNMGVHGALLVVEPSLTEYRSIRADVRRPAMRRLVSDLFDWPDMQYLTLRWSGRWTNVDARFCGLNGFPNLAVLFGTHYAGVKPWSFRRPRTMDRYRRYEDFRLWFNRYEALVTRDHPRLLELRSLRSLLMAIRALGRASGRSRASEALR